jgi:hypothetical protein
VQLNDDSRHDDARLRDLLREWQAPPISGSLEKRVLETSGPWWRFLFRGYVRVPVPLACCLTVLLLLSAWRAVRPPVPSAPCVAAARPIGCTSTAPGAC